MPAEAHLRVQAPEGFLRPGAPAQHRLLAGDDAAAHTLAGGHEGGGHVAAADVLAQRRVDLGTEIGGQLGH